MKHAQRRTLLVTTAVTAGLLSCPPGAAATYDESIDGDLPLLGLMKTLDLEAGTNSVWGSFHVRGSGPTDHSTDWDGLTFIVAPGHLLVSIRIELWETAGAIGNSTWAFWAANSAQYADGAPIEGQLPVGAPGMTAIAGSWGTGRYQVFQTGASWTPPLTSADYRIDLVIRDSLPAVPEPGSWALASAGLALLLWRRRGLRRA